MEKSILFEFSYYLPLWNSASSCLCCSFVHSDACLKHTCSVGATVQHSDCLHSKTGVLSILFLLSMPYLLTTSLQSLQEIKHGSTTHFVSSKYLICSHVKRTAFWVVEGPSGWVRPFGKVTATHVFQQVASRWWDVEPSPHWGQRPLTSPGQCAETLCSMTHSHHACVFQPGTPV